LFFYFWKNTIDRERREVSGKGYCAASKRINFRKVKYKKSQVGFFVKF
jgi:hypothetical protein